MKTRLITLLVTLTAGAAAYTAPTAFADVSTNTPARAGYCSVSGNSLSGKPLRPGMFLNLEIGQNTADPNYRGAVIADFVEGVGATCDPPAGFSFDGVTYVDAQGKASGLENAVYPLFTKQQPRIDPSPAADQAHLEKE